MRPPAWVSFLRRAREKVELFSSLFFLSENSKKSSKSKKVKESTTTSKSTKKEGKKQANSNCVAMLASTSRPMSPEVVSRNTSRVRAVGGSPVRAERAARSERKQHLRRLDSSAAAVAAVVVAARRRRSTSTSAVRASPASGDDGAPSSSTNQNRKRVVILGGTGRVGASTAAQLVRGPGGSQLDLVLVGKPEATPPSSSSPSSPPSAAVSAACRKVPALSKAIVQVAAVDSGDVEGLAGLLEGAACVVHCAGPFQSGGAGAGAGAGAEGGGRGGEKGGSIPAPLAAAIRAKVPYVDVCDDPDWAKVRKRKEEEEEEEEEGAFDSFVV